MAEEVTGRFDGGMVGGSSPFLQWDREKGEVGEGCLGGAVYKHAIGWVSRIDAFILSPLSKEGLVHTKVGVDGVVRGELIEFALLSNHG